MNRSYPVEVWCAIFAFACTDEGTTGCSLALVSRWTRQLSAHVRLQSLAAKDAKQLSRLADMLERTPREHRRTRFLTLSDSSVVYYVNGKIVQRLVGMDTYCSPLEARTVAEDVTRILATISSTLQILSMDLSHSACFPYTLVPVHLPVLQELAVKGKRSLPTTSAPFHPLPSLKRLHIHLTGCFSFGVEDWALLEDLPSIAPSLQYLHASGLVWSGGFPKYLRRTVYSTNSVRAALFNKLRIAIALTPPKNVVMNDSLVKAQYLATVEELEEMAKQDSEERMMLAGSRYIMHVFACMSMASEDTSAVLVLSLTAVGVVAGRLYYGVRGSRFMYHVPSAIHAAAPLDSRPNVLHPPYKHRKRLSTRSDASFLCNCWSYLVERPGVLQMALVVGVGCQPLIVGVDFCDASEQHPRATGGGGVAWSEDASVERKRCWITHPHLTELSSVSWTLLNYIKREIAEIAEVHCQLSPHFPPPKIRKFTFDSHKLHMSVVGLDEDLPVTVRNDVYPTIDPKTHYDGQTYAGKVVFITGASRGIGEETALQYARAGASLALVARKQATLDSVKAAILKEVFDAKVIAFPADVTHVEEIEKAIKATIDTFGRLDILIANAGVARPMEKPFAQHDPDGWWNTLEVNVRGVYNAVHFAIPYLQKTKGYVIAMSSSVAQLRFAHASDYAISKHALGRLVEFIVLENPDIKAFALHPGAIPTEMGRSSNAPVPLDDTVALPASTTLYLTSGRADWLSGRYVASVWDLGDVDRDWKTKIIEQNGLVSKLYIPQ
ncbi:hypothetical protein EW146_g417 [Bondarzewia mesenterica]|uniref:Uncharacterized protein n=1 Tax=Bondarzewia mesenterica TaxID=1095465 RepID=A0A4S4M9B8_9AGAM|nr:hypothetical protein EW146_g417 [Bondarzewia mesenterica]